MKNVQFLVEEHQCYGCGACSVVCPQKSIQMSITSMGFLIPVINYGFCNECGKCLNVCNKINPVQLEPIIGKELYALKTNSTNLNLACSSGGFSLVTALECLGKGNIFIGAVFSEKFRSVKHVICDQVTRVFDTVGSKYLQSDISEALSHILKSENNQRFVVMGTPCQIAGARTLLQKNKKSEQCLLVDFFCHGVPSYHLWWKYIEDLKKQIGEIKHFEFRFKLDSWHDYRIRIFGEKGFYSKSYIDDPFMAFFLQNYCLNEPCYQCPFRSESAADLRIGDFWGRKYIDEQTGVSIITPLNDKGAQYLLDLKGVQREKVDKGLLIDSQGNLNQSTVQKPQFYQQFQSDLQTLSFKKLTNKYLLLRKLKKTIKRLLKRA